jgi:hypothetical protein
MMVVESQYFPCVNYMSVLSKNEQCYIEQWETFRKMSFRNRCIIVGSNDLINLTIPVIGGRNNKQLMKDVRISYSENWQLQHWKSITSSYAKAPFYEYYNIYVEQLIKKQHSFLLDKNMDILLWLKKVMKLPLEIDLTGAYIDSVETKPKDYRNKWLPNNYSENETGIRYNQVFEEKLGFRNNVSFLDYLFCEGSTI